MSARPLSILDVSLSDWRINTSAFNSVLDKVGHRPLAIYSICGVTRSGKSFLLNYFIRYFESLSQNGNQECVGSFEWNSDLEPVTVGINLWSKPYFVQTDEGEVAVLLMDTQGLFDKNTTYRQNAIIFTLSCLLSSVMIYNQNKLITDDVLQTIQCFSNLADNIVYQYNNEKTTVANFNIGLASKIMFLLRDFERSGYEYGLHTAIHKPAKSKKNYFHDVFNFTTNTTFDYGCSMENQIVRDKIRKLYIFMAAYLLPHPGKQFTRNELSHPDDDFEQHAQAFVKMMVSKQYLVKKSIGGQIVSGIHFKESVLYLKGVCKRSEQYFADARSLEEFKIMTEYMTAMNAASNVYHKTLETLLCKYPEGASDEELQEAHKISLSKANEQFHLVETSYQSQSNNGNYKQKFLQSRREMVSTLFDKVKKSNEQKKEMAKKDTIIKYASIGAGITGIIAAVGAGVASAVLVPTAGVIVAGTVLTKSIVVASAVSGAGIVGVGTGVGAGAVIGVATSKGETLTNIEENEKAQGTYDNESYDKKND